MLKFKYDQISDTEMKEFKDKIDGMFWKLVANKWHPNEIEDVLQEIWMRLYRKKHLWDESKPVKVSTWMHKVAESVQINMGHKKRTRYDRMEKIRNMNVLHTEIEDMNNRRRNAMEKILADRTDKEKELIEILMNPSSDVLAKFGKKPGRFLSRSEIAAHFDMTTNSLQCWIRELRIIFGEYLDESKLRLHHG